MRAGRPRSQGRASERGTSAADRSLRVCRSGLRPDAGGTPALPGAGFRAGGVGCRSQPEGVSFGPSARCGRDARAPRERTSPIDDRSTGAKGRHDNTPTGRPGALDQAKIPSPVRSSGLPDPGSKAGTTAASDHTNSQAVRRVTAIEFPGCGGRDIKTRSTVTGAMNCTWDEVGNLDSVCVPTRAIAARESGAWTTACMTRRPMREGQPVVEPVNPFERRALRAMVRLQLQHLAHGLFLEIRGTPVRRTHGSVWSRTPRQIRYSSVHQRQAGRRGRPMKNTP